mmetsp:Transcript_22530/g.89466  ORF Transcript_22530/g.89466 Transcript_22530/m.89466 type:complete len:218 (-) Transcript_22530:440-1093(-)
MVPGATDPPQASPWGVLEAPAHVAWWRTCYAQRIATKDTSLLVSLAAKNVRGDLLFASSSQRPPRPTTAERAGRSEAAGSLCRDDHHDRPPQVPRRLGQPRRRRHAAPRRALEPRRARRAARRRGGDRGGRLGRGRRRGVDPRVARALHERAARRARRGRRDDRSGPPRGLRVVGPQYEGRRDHTQEEQRRCSRGGRRRRDAAGRPASRRQRRRRRR